MNTSKSWAKGFFGLLAVLMLFVCVGQKTAMALNQENPKKKLGLSLKLSGGFGYLLNGAGDINAFRQGQQAILSDQYTGEGYTKTFDWPRPWFLPDLTADVIVRLGPYIGFGFGTGYIHGLNKGRISIGYQGYDDNWGNAYSIELEAQSHRNHRLTAVPLKFDLYFFKSLGKAQKFTFFARAGAGYYLGKLDFDYPGHITEEDTWRSGSQVRQYVFDYQTDMTGSAKCDTWGYQGGLGFELKLSRVLSFGAEVCGRYVNFANWEGDLSISDKVTVRYENGYGESYTDTDSYSDKFSGSLWTYQLRDEENNKDYTFMMLYEEQPANKYLLNTKKSALNLNSLSFALSVKVHFDLF